MAIEIHTGPVPGRIVWGHPAKSQQKKDQQTKAVVLRDGKPVEQWVFGVAFPKQAFITSIWPSMDAEAKSLYPHGTPPNFSWKYKDGDGVDGAGKRYSEREGYAGCYVLTISTEAFAPPMFKNVNGAWAQMNGDEIKCGDFVALVLNLKGNAPTNRSHTPGLYVNPVAIQFVAYGTEIISRTSVDPNAVFGGVQMQIPVGASLTPMVPAGAAAMPGTTAPMPGQPQPGMPMQPMPGQPQPGMPMQPMPGQPQPGMPMQPMPGQPYQPPAAPGYAPAPDFIHNAGMPAQPGYQQPSMPAQPQPGYQQPPMPGQPMPGFPAR